LTEQKKNFKNCILGGGDSMSFRDLLCVQI
jgi:hypothetical protein